MSRSVEVVRTYLELTTPGQLRPASDEGPAFVVARRPGITTTHYRRLYEGVGARWYWHDRNAWSDQQLAAHLAQSGVSVWECLVGNSSAGFFELVRHDDGTVEIGYFGLMPEFIGRGLGKTLLTRAVQEAWALGANRVWLHTCTLDSPVALPNYLARGFSIVRKETYTAKIDN